MAECIADALVGVLIAGVLQEVPMTMRRPRCRLLMKATREAVLSTVVATVSVPIAREALPSTVMATVSVPIAREALPSTVMLQ
jgi:hypothetical protein